MTVLIKLESEFEMASYTIGCSTPDDLVEEMPQEGTNFIKPGTPCNCCKTIIKENG
jgi:hypothetical protein